MTHTNLPTAYFSLGCYIFLLLANGVQTWIYWGKTPAFLEVVWLVLMALFLGMMGVVVATIVVLRRHPEPVS